MKYLLDTNIIAYYLKGEFPAISKHFETVRADEICIPSIVIAEIEYGAQKSKDYEKTISVYRSFTRNFKCLGFDDKETASYGLIRRQLEKEGTPIGPNDLVIAATAIANDMILVTHNIREFSRIKGLKVEDWTV